MNDETKLLAEVLQAGFESLCEDLGWADAQDPDALAALIAQARHYGVSIPDELEGYEHGA